MDRAPDLSVGSNRLLVLVLVLDLVVLLRAEGTAFKQSSNPHHPFQAHLAIGAQEEEEDGGLEEQRAAARKPHSPCHHAQRSAAATAASGSPQSRQPVLVPAHCDREDGWGSHPG